MLRLQTTEPRRLMSLARTAPDHPVLSVEDAAGQWTVHTAGELYERVAATAGHALAAGLEPGRHTLVALPNGEGLVRAVLASWMLGCTPVIVPPGATEPERRALFEGPGPVAEEAFSWSGAELAAALEPDASRPVFSPRGLEPGITWYLPTGGTTGLPALFPVTPRPSTALTGARRLMRSSGWSPGAVQLSIGPLTHAAPLMMCMAGIGGGAHVVMPRRLDPVSLRSAIERFAPTWCQLTPHQMALIDANQGLWDALCRSLTGMLHTSAPCPQEVKRRWIARLGGDRVHETYSSTQAVGTTICDGDEWLAHPGTVGRPFLSNQVLIADGEGRPLPPGAVGEVFMRSEWTEVSAGDGPRRLRGDDGDFLGIGDLGYTDDDGYLYLTGRLDDIVLVGGANVSTREVEGVLLTHPGVSEAVVVTRPDPLLGDVLHAVVVPSGPGDPPDAEGVREHCRGRLSPYKIPLTVDVVEALPRSHSGKVERFLRT
ncbi:class I adenylate-forming enzyme family protein [Streptomyces sp. NPDC056045]|uniref:class I adenylate-forming enzyme family protein n=1 Tax=Streptomyces sp. NPDC056045 TaxID=3345691 RepID=UPI0035DDD6A0